MSLTGVVFTTLKELDPKNHWNSEPEINIVLTSLERKHSAELINVSLQYYRLLNEFNGLWLSKLSRT